MKTILNSGFKFLTSVNHQDMAFAFALKQEGDYANIYYSIQEKRFSNTSSSPQKKKEKENLTIDDWTLFKPLTFPSWIRPIGMRLGAYQVEGFDELEKANNTSVVYTEEDAFVAISDNRTISIFRKVKRNQVAGSSILEKYRIFVDRFIYDEKLGQLVNVKEVRYMRSENSDVPESQLDSFGAHNLNGVDFLEPTSEIDLGIDVDFKFAVQFVPVAGEAYKGVWHIFTLVPDLREIQIHSIPHSNASLFDTSFCNIAKYQEYKYNSLNLNLISSDGNIDLAASLFYQQEKTMSQGGEVISVKRGTNLMLVVTHKIGVTYGTTSIDFDVGMDGYLAGMDESLDATPRHSIASSGMRFYGTVLKLDGENDYVQSNEIQSRVASASGSEDLNVNSIENGLTVEMWANPENDFSKNFVKSFWMLSNVQLSQNGSIRKCTIYFNYNQSGCLKVVIPELQKEIKFLNVPSISFNQWNYLSLQFPPIDASSQQLLLYINNLRYTSSGGFNLEFKNTLSSQLTIGEAGKNKLGSNHSNSKFKGLLSEVRAWFRYSQEPSTPYQELTGSQESLVLCEPFSQGSGNITIKSSYPSSASLGSNNELVSGFSIVGAQWISSIIPSRQNSKVAYYDQNLLKCKVGQIKNEELQNTSSSCWVQSFEKPVLRDSADGILRLYHNRNDDDLKNRIGVTHFDSSTSRFQVMYYWQNEQPEDALILPKLIFSAIDPGTDMNDATITIRHDYTEANCIHIEFRKDIVAPVIDNFTLKEEWKSIPYIINGEALTVQDVINIVNGKAQDFYDYTANFSRTGIGLSEANLLKPGSLLFQADSLTKDKEDMLEVFPQVEVGQFIEQSLTKKHIFGVDSTWVLEPVLPALYFNSNSNVNVSVEKDYKTLLNEDFTIESWVNARAMSSMSSSRTSIIQSVGSLKTDLSYDAEGEIHLGIKSKLANGRDIQFESENAELTEASWEHLAMTYKTGYALDFQNQMYVDIENEKSLDIQDAMTIEAWYFMPDIPRNETQIILSKWDHDQNDKSWKFYILKSGKLGFELIDEEGNEFIINSKLSSSSSIQSTDTVVDLVPNQWNHVAARYAKPQKRSFLFFDGEEDVHFTIPAFKEEWHAKMTIEFETAIDGNNAEDESTFIAYRYLDGLDNTLKDAITIQQDKRIANKHKLIIKLEEEEIALVDEEANAYNYHFEPDKSVHLALTIDATNAWTKLHLYIDGVFVASGTTIQTLATRRENINSGGWLIGAATLTDNAHKHFSGYLSDVRFWNTIRTTKEIVDHINVAIDKKEKGLLAAFPMNQTPLITEDGSDTEPFITNIVTNETFKANKEGAVWEYKDISGKMDLLINGIVVTTTNNIIYNDEELATGSTIMFDDAAVQNSIRVSKANINIGRQISVDSSHYLNGTLDNVRIWRKLRLPSQIDYYRYHNLGEGEKTDIEPSNLLGLTAAWTFDEGRGATVLDHAGLHPGNIIGLNIKIDEEDEDTTTEDIWIPSNFNGKFDLYKNGKAIRLKESEESYNALNNNIGRIVIGLSNEDFYLGEVRLWSKILNGKAINDHKNKVLIGDEKGLEAYWPMADGSGKYLQDLSVNNTKGTINSSDNSMEAINDLWVNASKSYSLNYAIPISSDSLSCINTSTGMASQESDNLQVEGKVAVTEYDQLSKSLLAYITKTEEALHLKVEGSDEELVRVFIGQVQYNPKIVGFIEGAPPVPSENLSVDSPTNPDKYVGTATVSLSREGEATTSFSQSTGKELNFSSYQHLGVQFESEVKLSVGTPFLSKILKLLKAEGEVFGESNQEFDRSNTDTQSITGATTEEEEYSLTLGGSWQPNIYNIPSMPSEELYVQAPRLYRPNNMAVAVVKSKTADLYALQSRKTKRTVDYVYELDPNIPEDTNYIMFEVNPDYIRNGSLDGRIGFDNDNQYPQLENDLQKKASFYRAEEAYQLEAKIEREQEEWKNMIQQLNDAPSDFIRRTQGLSLVNNYVWTADGGFLCESKQVMGSHQEQHDYVKNNYFDVKLGAEGHLMLGASAFLVGPSVKGDFMFGRSLNTSKSSENTTDTSFSLKVDVEGEGFLSMQANVNEPDVILITVDNSAYTTAITNLNNGYPIPSSNTSFYNQLVSKQIIVELNGTNPVQVEKYLITKIGENKWNWANPSQEYIVEAIDGEIIFKTRTEQHPGQYPILYQSNNCPGKVTGYRFKSFYLHPERENFDILTKGYDNVPIISPSWLSNTKNPDAQAMRDALKTPNSIWRIFHRVTYVSRVPPNENTVLQDADQDKDNYVKGNSVWEDYTSQLFQKPDAISLANNAILIATILGNAGGTYATVDPTSEDYIDVLKANINLWINNNETANQLNIIEKEHLYNLMLNYFRGYFLEDPTVMEKPKDQGEIV